MVGSNGRDAYPSSPEDKPVSPDIDIYPVSSQSIPPDGAPSGDQEADGDE